MDSYSWSREVPDPILTDSAITAVGVPPLAYGLAVGVVLAVEHDHYLGVATTRSEDGTSMVITLADGRRMLVGLSVRELAD